MVHAHNHRVDDDARGDEVVEPLVPSDPEGDAANGVLRLLEVHVGLDGLQDALHIRPLLLLLRLQRRAVVLCSQSAELVDDDTDEQVDRKERADEHERVEVDRVLGV